MQLNGEIIGGLVTEDHRGWDKMSLEAMYDELSKELIQINSDIRSNPDWAPTKSGNSWGEMDLIKVKGAKLISAYQDFMRPSGIKAPMDIFIKSKTFSRYADIFKKLITDIYNGLKDMTSDAEKLELLDIVKEISLTDPQEVFDITHPVTGEVICSLYTPEDKMLASDVLKNLGGNINFNPQKFNIKRQANSQEYKDAWNKVVKTLDSQQFDNDVLTQIRDAIKKGEL